jgi:hypothetical protein
MGLDIYLYRYEDKDEYDKQKTECEVLESQIEEQVIKDIGYTKSREEFGKDKLVWGKRDYSGGLFETEKYHIEPNKELKEKYFALTKERRKKAAEEKGYHDNGYGLEPKEGLRVGIEENHPKYPDHYFKIGYLRSSYNSAGINSVLSTKGLGDLHYIFGRYDDEYTFKPDWEESLKRCIEIKEKYLEKSTSDGGVYIYEVSSNVGSSPVWESELGFYHPKSKEQAMEVYRHQLKNPGDYDNWFGAFRLENPEKVKAIIPGTGMFGNKVYVVAQKEDSDTGVNDWYYKALEIIEDTIKYVLNQKDSEKYYLHWSG